MDGFLRWKLTQAGGSILDGSSMKKPISPHQHLNLPDICSSEYLIADEPFPEVSGLLEDTVSQSFLLNEPGTPLHSSCIPSEHRTKHASEGVSVLEKDILCVEMKNSTFDVKDQSDACVNATVEVHNTSEKSRTFVIESGNVTFDLVQTRDTKANSTVDISNPDCTRNMDISAPVARTESGNFTIDLVQTNNTKANSTVDIPNPNCTHDVLNLCGNNSGPSNTTTELPNEKREGIVDMEVENEKLHNSLSPSGDANNHPSIKISEKNNAKVNVTFENVEVSDNASQVSCEIIQSCSPTEKPKNNITPELTSQYSPVLKNTPIEIQRSSTEMKNVSRNSSVFCLDDTLDMKTSVLVTSTPIVFEKESKFEILRDLKPTPMRRRLSVINSIEVHSNDGLVSGSHHDETNAAQIAENSNHNQKVSIHGASSHSTSGPTDQNKPPTKPTARRQIPRPSNRNLKSSLPPMPSNPSSLVAAGPKLMQTSRVPHQPATDSSVSQLCNRKPGLLNKGKPIKTVKNSTLASTVKTSTTSSVSGNNFKTVSKPSSSSVPQMKPSGLQPPTRKRLALRTPQATLLSVETIQPQTSNKPTDLQGTRKRSLLLPRQNLLNKDDLSSAKKTRMEEPTALQTSESNAVQPAETAHDSDCVNCSHHQEKLEKLLQEFRELRSECKNWGPLCEKLMMCVEEM